MDMTDDLETQLEAEITRTPDAILRFFRFAHLRLPLGDVSKEFARLALWTVRNIPSSAERTVALRKLLEGKDAAVRAALSV